MTTPPPVALITGAAQGIGRRTAEVLAARGYRLALNDLRSPAATLASVRALGGEALPVPGNVADAGDVAALVGATLAHFGQIDVLVNNAGVSCIAPAEETSLEQWKQVLDINLTGPFLLCITAGRAMLTRGSGSIVNIASIAGLFGIADRAAYNASKHGLIGLTRTLAAEWGGRGVRVNAVCPGWVKTAMDVRDAGSGAYSDTDITQRVPMGRFAAPDDIAQAVAFLADPATSGFINGHSLVVDGGWTSDASWETLRLRKRV